MPEHETHKFRWMTMQGFFVYRPIDAELNVRKYLTLPWRQLDGTSSIKTTSSSGFCGLAESS